MISEFLDCRMSWLELVASLLQNRSLPSHGLFLEHSRAREIPDILLKAQAAQVINVGV